MRVTDRFYVPMRALVATPGQRRQTIPGGAENRSIALTGGGERALRGMQDRASNLFAPAFCLVAPNPDER
jgi:hypothetical protein